MNDMGKIATKAFCNTLKTGAFSGANLNQCPTKKQIIDAGFEVSGNYKDNQLVQELDIQYVTWVYTFERTDSNSTSFTAAPQTKTFTINSVKQKYINGVKSGNPVNVDWNFASQSATSSFTYTKTNQTTLTISSKNNTTTNSRAGGCILKQNEGTKTLSIDVSQERGFQSYSYTAAPTPTGLVQLTRSQSPKTVQMNVQRHTLWNGLITSSEPYDLGFPSTRLDNQLSGYVSCSVTKTSVTVSMIGFTKSVSGNITLTYSSNRATAYISVMTNINS